LLVAPARVIAQRKGKIYRIGIIISSGTTSEMIGPQPRSATVSALLRGLHEQGYAYGRDFVIEARGGEGKPAQFPMLAAELVRLKVDMIVAAGPMLPVIKEATSSIPIVMVGVNDPVGEGLVRSLAHPGGNITGLSNQSAELAGKRLEVLKELVPATALVAVIWEPTSATNWQAADAVARRRGWNLLSLEVRDRGEIESAFAAATAARVGGLLVVGASAVLAAHRQVVELAANHRLPAMYSLRRYVDAGGLMSYAANLDEMWRQAAFFVDRIIKGAKPADLPVEQPTKFELLINLTTAKALNLAIPQSLLLRADEVIR
jgi:putative tryptophan/tyrosine transport system substrate-binding protein